MTTFLNVFVGCRRWIRRQSHPAWCAARRAVGTALWLGVLGTVTACHGLMDVTDPTLVQDKDIANPDGANARRIDVFGHFTPAAISLANDVAVFTDERIVDLPLLWSDPTYYLDRRDGLGYENLFASSHNSDPHLGGWDDIIVRSSIAIPQIRAFTPDSLKGDYLAEMFAFRGYALLQLAEDMCPGFPINDIVDNQAIYSGPYTTDSATKYALTQLDSVIADAHDSTALIAFARVMQGRALLNLGQYQQAAAAVTSVPTDFSYTTIPILSGSGQNIFPQPYAWDPSDNYELRFAVGDTEGTHGLPFVAAHDPRVPTVYRLQRYDNPADSLYDETKYTDATNPMVLASGIEARLIEAEAAINAGDPSWFSTLNTLRATMITPAMDPIPAMPSTTADQIDLLYKERAFWLYLTGRRLGDLRRLIRNYGRSPETVFPTGPYSSRGGNYGTATAIPFVQATEAFYNPKVIAGCTTR